MIPEWRNIGFTRICRSLFGGIARRFQSMCYPCEKSDHNAERHAVGMTNPRRKSLKKTQIHPITLKFGPFQDHQILPK